MSSSRPHLNVLFVCTGNTCRSPLAALALQAELGEDAAAEVEISSAGTGATVGAPASEGSRQVAAAEGLDLSGHRSRPVTRELVQAADFVFVMSPSQRQALEALGAAPGQVHVVSEWPEPGEPDLPVFDPFGASREAYEECWSRLRRHMRRIAPHVRQALQRRMS